MVEMRFYLATCLFFGLFFLTQNVKGGSFVKDLIAARNTRKGAGQPISFPDELPLLFKFEEERQMKRRDCHSSVSVKEEAVKRQMEKLNEAIKETLEFDEQERNDLTLNAGYNGEFQDPFGWIQKKWESIQSPNEDSMVAAVMENVSSKRKKFEEQLKLVKEFADFAFHQYFLYGAQEYVALERDDMKLSFRENGLYGIFSPLATKLSMQENPSSPLRKSLDMYIEWQKSFFLQRILASKSTYCIFHSYKDLAELLPLPSFTEVVERVRVVPLSFSKKKGRNQFSCNQLPKIKKTSKALELLLLESQERLFNALSDEVQVARNRDKTDIKFYFSDAFMNALTSLFPQRAFRTLEYLKKKAALLLPRYKKISAHMNEMMQTNTHNDLTEVNTWGSSKDGFLLELDPLKKKLTITLYPLFPEKELHDKMKEEEASMPKIEETVVRKKFPNFSMISDITRFHLQFQENLIVDTLYKELIRFCSGRPKTLRSLFRQQSI